VGWDDIYQIGLYTLIKIAPRRVIRKEVDKNNIQNGIRTACDRKAGSRMIQDSSVSVSARRTSGWPRFLSFCKVHWKFPPPRVHRVSPRHYCHLGVHRSLCENSHPFPASTPCTSLQHLLAPSLGPRAASSSSPRGEERRGFAVEKEMWNFCMSNVPATSLAASHLSCSHVFLSAPSSLSLVFDGALVAASTERMFRC